MMFYDFLTIAKPTEYVAIIFSIITPAASLPRDRYAKESDNNISGYKNILRSWRCNRARNMVVEKNILDASASALRENIPAEL